MLDQDGVVSERHFQRNYRVRESGRDLLAQVWGARLPGETLAEVTLGEERVGIRAHLNSPTYWRYQRVHLMVDLTITPGYHLYAAPVPDGYTRLALEVAAELAEIGAPRFPSPNVFHVAGLNGEFWVYESAVRLAVPIEFVMNRG